ncbi:MAG: hypothetical protein RL376_531 [Verrucomicrobiota bacterium]|jgi:hypothetical protein
MPIYEYYCPRNHTVYQFFAKTLAQGKKVPKCPDNPAWPMQKTVSQFAFTGRAVEPAATEAASEGEPDDARMEAAMAAMETDFANVDENDPRAMARMMRKMADLTGEKIDTEMEEVVRKLEEGMDPEKLEEQLGAGFDDGAGEEGGCGYDGECPAAGGPAKSEAERKEARMRWKIRRATTAPRRDPVLYDYDS